MFADYFKLWFGRVITGLMVAYVTIVVWQNSATVSTPTPSPTPPFEDEDDMGC